MKFDKLKDQLFINRMTWFYRQAQKVKAKPYCFFEDGHLHVGQQSKHRELYARLWRTALRIKRYKNVS